MYMALKIAAVVVLEMAVIFIWFSMARLFMKWCFDKREDKWWAFPLWMAGFFPSAIGGIIILLLIPTWMFGLQ